MSKNDNRTKTVVKSTGEEIFTRLPSVGEQQEADWEYSRMFNRAIRSGIPPRAALIKELIKQGVWSQEDDKAIADMRLQIDTKQIELEEISKEDPIDEAKKTEILKAIEEINRAFIEKTQQLNTFLSHCAESKAEDAKLYFLVHLVTENTSGKRIWATFEDFLKENGSERTNEALVAYMLKQAGINLEDQEKVKANIAEKEQKDGAEKPNE